MIDDDDRDDDDDRPDWRCRGCVVIIINICIILSR